MQKKLCRRALRLTAALTTAIAFTGSVWADTYPSKSIKIIVPYAPGGATDVVARLVSQKLGTALGQSIVVENRAGANGIIGTEAVARAAPDGYTLLMNTAGAQTLNPVLYKTNYEPLKSFEPVSLIAKIGFVMVVHPSLPVKTVQEYLALVNSKAKPMSYSSGTAMIELVTESFKSAAKTPDIASIPYKGTGPQMTAAVAGEVGMTVDPFVSIPMIKAGKLRPLAVFSATRSPALPDVPTMQESGVSGLNFNSWAALLAPAGTPKEIVTRLHTELSRIVATPEMRDRLAGLDYEVVNSTPEQLATTINEDVARWQKIVKETNYKVSQ
jgi:tripartite-type tricarboxylate transporter receptor subunit TctC